MFVWSTAVMQSREEAQERKPGVDLFLSNGMVEVEIWNLEDIPHQFCYVHCQIHTEMWHRG